MITLNHYQIIQNNRVFMEKICALPKVCQVCWFKSPKINLWSISRLQKPFKRERFLCQYCQLLKIIASLSHYNITIILITIRNICKKSKIQLLYSKIELLAIARLIILKVKLFIWNKTMSFPFRKMILIVCLCLCE